MEKKIVIKNHMNGSIIFEFEKENNTIKDAVVEAVKSGADLRYANLYGADLRYANLRDADLRDADLYGADLRYANLRNANLCDADLRDANLYNAGLRGANLRDAKLNGANLYGAKLNGANNVPFIPFNCPSDGSFIGWKKVSTYEGDFLIKLQIPENARRCSATTEKCRCDKANVLSITNIKSGEQIDTVTNVKLITPVSETKCVYEVGKMVYPDNFDDNRWNECSHGIHFFIDKQSAIDYPNN